jgi:manganese/zinc/iron transport system substrate-binding protein
MGVVCTTGMIGDVARQIAGEHATVRTLMGEGVDPHLYRPTRTDIAALMDAGLVFYNGLLLEGKMTDALVRAATGGRKVYAVTELIPEDALLEPETMEGHFDPHVWMDPLAWATTVGVIRDALMEADPANAGAYRENAARYARELEALHAYCAGALSSVPEGQRVLVTAHDAFNYLGRRYGFEVVGIQGISTESEAGVRDVERLVDMLVERGIPSVFVETTVPDRNVRALIAGCRARGHEVSIGGSLYSDAMGPRETYEGTYLGMIDHNATTIARALGGSAPPSGRRGKLSPPSGAPPTPEEE